MHRSILLLVVLMLGTGLAHGTQTPVSHEKHVQSRKITEGSFSATPGAGLDGVLEGKAMFDIQRFDDVAVLKIILYNYVDDDDYETVNLLIMDGGIPDVGEYPIGEDETFMAAYLEKKAGRQIIGGGQAGRILITSADAHRISGNFRFSGELVHFTDTSQSGTYTIEGSFYALRGDERTLPTRL